jgi:hypothetical protein
MQQKEELDKVELGFFIDRATHPPTLPGYIEFPEEPRFKIKCAYKLPNLVTGDSSNGIEL